MEIFEVVLERRRERWNWGSRLNFKLNNNKDFWFPTPDFLICRIWFYFDNILKEFLTHIQVQSLKEKHFLTGKESLYIFTKWKKYKKILNTLWSSGSGLEIFKSRIIIIMHKEIKK